MEAPGTSTGARCDPGFSPRSNQGRQSGELEGSRAEPVELDAADLALRTRNIRRWGWLFATLCFVLVVAALIVMLSLNRESADLGLALGLLAG